LGFRLVVTLSEKHFGGSKVSDDKLQKKNVCFKTTSLILDPEVNPVD
jgi:hypothetical protein